MKFTHLQYGRDHGPDHIHKGKLKTWQNPLKCISHTCNMNTMVATTVPTIYTRGNWTFVPEAEFFSLLRNNSYCNSFTFGNLRIHPHSGGDSGGESLEKNGGVPLTVRGTFLETKTEGSPPQWGGLFWGRGDSWGGLRGTNTPTRKWSMYIPNLVGGPQKEGTRTTEIFLCMYSTLTE